MGKSQAKRRSTSTQPHQASKASSTKKRRKVDVTRILLIIIGLLVVFSMILSLFR